MSDLSDLNHRSITEMDTDEAIELLRQIRLSRRIPMKKVSKVSKAKKPSVEKITNINADMAAEILKILGGN